MGSVTHLSLFFFFILVIPCLNIADYPWCASGFTVCPNPQMAAVKMLMLSLQKQMDVRVAASFYYAV